ncbi:MAG: PKD domain-containing protein, partial [Pseudomonadota bacterium]
FLTVNFKNLSVSKNNNDNTPIKKYTWDFGNGDTSTLAEPTYTFQDEGPHTVTLKVTDVNDREDSYSREILLKNTYCTASSGLNSDYWIERVMINNFSNTSENSSYSDFSQQGLITLNQFGANTLRFTPGIAANDRQLYWRVWIDLNHDADFKDDAELVYEGFAIGELEGEFTTIPKTALPTRMRVAMTWVSYPTQPCINVGNGEVEDYTVVFGTVEPPLVADFNYIKNGLSATFTNTSIAPDSATYLWDFGDGNQSHEKFPTHTYSDRGTYDVALTVKQIDGKEDTSLQQIVMGYYCPARSETTEYEGIADVSFNGQTKNSGNDASGYSDFTDTTFTATEGSTITFTASPWFNPSTGPAKQYWRVWIDYNRDYQFTDDEKVIDKNVDYANPPANLVQDINIPSNLLEDSQNAIETRMRVIMRYNNIPQSCDNFAIPPSQDGGEVEDYTIRITRD